MEEPSLQWSVSPVPKYARAWQIDWAAGASDGPQGQMTVWLNEDHEVVRVAIEYSHSPAVTADHQSDLTGVPRITGGDLQRQPWALLLRAAEGAALARPPLEALKRTRRRPEAVTTARPGRRGHPREFYEDIARRTLELQLQGSRNPAAVIAAERSYNERTIRGIQRKCRELGMFDLDQPEESS